MWGAVKQPAHDPWSRLPKAQRGTTTRGTSAAPAPTGPSRSAIRVQRNRLRLKAQAAARLHPVLATLLDSIVPARPMRNHRRTRCSRSVQLPRCGLNRWPGETFGRKADKLAATWIRHFVVLAEYSPSRSVAAPAVELSGKSGDGLDTGFGVAGECAGVLVSALCLQQDCRDSFFAEVSEG